MKDLSAMFADVSTRSVLIAVLDIALVYYLIYRVLLAIRGTRAGQIIVGVVLIGAAFFAADRLQLSTVSWLLDNLIAYVIIILIVVFQTDIRRVLGRLGQGLRPWARGREVVPAIEEVVGAVEQLARGRVGAIIVLERDDGVDEFIEDATRLDAEVSRQLLVTLFVASPSNELHDGAVVIGRRQRIEWARALLPLSRASDLGPEFGTRHRAALGVSEETDAVVLVVSEERGEISLCLRGSIARDLEPTALRRALHGIFERGRTDATAESAEAAAALGRAVASLGHAAEPRGGAR